MEDLLNFSKAESDYLEHIETILSRLDKDKLYVSSKKCSFLREETNVYDFSLV